MVDALQKLDKLKRVYQPGDVIIREGDASAEFYILLQGRAKVVIQENDVAEIAASQGEIFFGEMASILQEARAASIVALEKCVVLCIPADGLVKVLSLSPSLLSKLLKQLALRVKKLNDEETILKHELSGIQQKFETKFLESLTYVKSILGLIDIMAEKSQDPALKSLKDYILQTNPLNLRSGSTANLDMQKMTDLKLDKFFT